jgi:predicted transcriptional regulator
MIITDRTLRGFLNDQRKRLDIIINLLRVYIYRNNQNMIDIAAVRANLHNSFFSY